MLSHRSAGILVAVALAACGTGNGNQQADAGGIPDAGAGPTAPPTVTSVSPNTGPADGGTSVTVAGTGFATGATVRFGGVTAPTATVVSSTELSAVTPSGAAGAVTVEVINPDNRFGSLASAFTYTSSMAANTTIGWCNLQFPTSTTGAAGSPLTLFGRVYVMGLTDGTSTTAAPGIVMQAAIGMLDGGFTWDATTFNIVTMNDDEFQLVTTYPAAVGTYASLFRAQLNGGPWSYCETDGIHAAIDPAELGQVIVTSVDSVDWCDLQFPLSVTTNPGDPLTFYGQVYKAGLTTAMGAAPGIAMQAGIAPVDGGWSWNPTTFNVNVGNNDEFQWETTGPPVGDYLTAFRASFDGGPWTYCETDGPHPTLVPASAGTLDVVTAPTQIGWCNLQFPQQASGTPNAPLTLYSRVYVLGVTDQPNQQGPGISVQIAVGNPDAGVPFVFGNGTFDANTDNGANDEFEVNTTYPAVLGTYASLARAQINGGAWTYCEIDGPHATPAPAEYGSVTVVAPSPLTVDWCNLQYPTTDTTNAGDPITFYGEVYKAGLTDPAGQAPGIVMQAGISSDAGMSWVNATYDVDVGNNDEYEWVTAAPAVGQYATAFRASLDGGIWTYCEVDGPHPTFVLQEAGSLTVVPVAPETVNWCDLQFPTSATGAPGAPFTLYGQVYQPGLTDAVGQAPGIAMQGGLGWLDGGWTWAAAAFQSDQGNNNQYQWQTTDPTTPGTYGTAFRAMLDGGPWSYCEVDGIHPTLDPAEVGALTVAIAAPPTVQWCNLQFPVTDTSAPSSPLTLYGEVYVPNLTNQAGQAPGIAMQAGVSTASDGGWLWQDAVFNSDQGNNNEYQASITTPAAVGTYLTAFRAMLDGGPWSYCEVDGLNATLDPTDAGTLTVASATVGSVEWCNLQFPLQQTSNPGEQVTFYGRVYEAGVTDQVGNTGAGVYLEFGLSGPDAGWAWSAAAFDANVDGLTPGDHANDEFDFAETVPAVGNYATAYRAALDGGPWAYCETDGIHAQLDPSETGQLTVVAPTPPPTVEWCNLQFPTQASGTPGAPLTLYGQVYQPGLTTQAGAAPGIVMQAGLSAADGGWGWNPTVFNVNVGNNDEFEWQTADPAVGSYLTAFRAQLDGGPWVYCETDGEHATLDLAEAGTLTVSLADGGS